MNTPRTDASEAKVIKNGLSPIICYCYANDMAKLETELTAVTEQRDRLAEDIRITLMENLHLADGYQCTLKLLKDAIRFDLDSPENSQEIAALNPLPQEKPL